jgi:hypothetical protein
MNIQLSTRHTKREVQFLELWQHNGWQLKCYGVRHPECAMPDDAMMDIAKKAMTQKLPPADDPDFHGAGFVIAHVALDAIFVLLDLWTGENMLRQNLFVSYERDPVDFKNEDESGLMACVWEMGVQSFERKAWIDCVLNGVQGPDIRKYLSLRLNGVV